MIEFAVLKYKHYRKAQELHAAVEKKEADEEDILKFAASLVKRWDFLDIETGEPMPLGVIDELTREQIAELLNVFSTAFTRGAEVPKESA